MVLWFRLAVLSWALVWFLSIWWACHVDSVHAAHRETVQAWKQHFKDNVASGWMFYDGLGG